MNRLAVALMAGAVSLMAQITDRITVPFSDASRPRFVKVNAIHGRITVRTHAGKDVIVDLDGDRKEEPRTGMRRLNVAPGLTIEEENNVVNIRTSPSRRANLNIQVPAQTSLNIRSLNDCNIDVKGFEGDVDANCTNGSVILENISGSVIAHALNGRVRVTMDRLSAEKPMALSTLNGDVDLTLPASTKADVKLKSTNGDIYTDFDVTIGPMAGSTIARSREGGKYRVQIDHGVQGKINGGGPLISLTTLNGRIYLRKK